MSTQQPPAIDWIKKPTTEEEAALLASGSFFRSWLDKLHSNFQINKLEVTHFDFYQGKPFVVMARVRGDTFAYDANGNIVRDANGVAVVSALPGGQKWLRNVMVLPGGAVILPILQVQENGVTRDYALLTQQPRMGTAVAVNTEAPGGMVLESNVTIGALRELAEETGLQLQPEDLSLLGRFDTIPGLTNDAGSVYLAFKKIAPKLLDKLQNQLAGAAGEEEVTRVKLVPVDEVPKVAGQDAKTMLAYYAYKSGAYTKPVPKKPTAFLAKRYFWETPKR